MRQRPGTGELERLAASILRDQPLAPDRTARSYEQRLAAKALSIAAYDREHGAADRVQELKGFEALYGAAAIAAVAADADRRIAALNRSLAAEIRAGKWDDAPLALRELLITQVRARLARTNPNYLNARMPDA